jgi:2-polyprenyl-6-methoxyphenol hydroxylase-like FAD-dependent oxidoreductase
VRSDLGDDLDPSLVYRLESLSFLLGILVWDGADEVGAPALASARSLDIKAASRDVGKLNSVQPHQLDCHPRLVHRAEVTDLIEESGRIVGVRAQTPDGPLEVRADLVVGAAWRHSTVRDRAGLDAAAGSPPMDVLWFRLSRHAEETLPFFQSGPGRVLICIDRGDYWQIAYLISGGTFSAVQAAGLEAFRTNITAIVPAFTDRVTEIGHWDNVQVLSVRVDRLRH